MTAYHEYIPSRREIEHVASSVIGDHINGYNVLDVEACVSEVWNELRLSHQPLEDIPLIVYQVVRTHQQREELK